MFYIYEKKNIPNNIIEQFINNWNYQKILILP